MGTGHWKTATSTHRGSGGYIRGVRRPAEGGLRGLHRRLPARDGHVLPPGRRQHRTAHGACGCGGRGRVQGECRCAGRSAGPGQRARIHVRWLLLDGEGRRLRRLHGLVPGKARRVLRAHGRDARRALPSAHRTGQAALKVTPFRTGGYLTAPSNPRAASCPMITSANPPTSRWKSEGFNVWVMPDQTRRPVETS